MPSIIALSCPVCGAPLKPGDEKCAFCGAYIFIKSDLPKLDRRTLNQSVIHEHIASFRGRVRSNHFDEEAHYGLGLAYFNLGLIEESIDQLSEAAKLMPENPHIQAQLAVVYREQLRAGDKSAFAKMQQRMQRTLKLDPDHLEGLSLQASVYAAEGRDDLASQVIARIRDISAERAKQVAEGVLVRRIEQRLAKSDWRSSITSLDDLAGSNRTEAKRLVAEYLLRHRESFPLKVASPSITASRKNWFWGAFGLSTVLIMMINVMFESMTGSMVVDGVGLVLWFLIFVGLFLMVFYRFEAALDRKSTTITEDKINSVYSSYEDLRKLGNVFEEYKEGRLVAVN